MSLPYGPPFAVSPLIRGLRWGLLLAGIIYARGKQKLYNAMEASHREEQARLKVIKDRELAALKKKIGKEEAAAVKLFESGKLFDVDNDDDTPPPKKQAPPCIPRPPPPPPQPPSQPCKPKPPAPPC